MRLVEVFFDPLMGDLDLDAIAREVSISVALPGFLLQSLSVGFLFDR